MKVVGLFLLSLAQRALFPAAAALNLSDVPCGLQSAVQSHVRKAKIVGGSRALRGEFPWIVSVKIDGMHLCGGVLIHRRYVLSAAHCFHRRGKEQVRVLIGAHDLRGREIPGHSEEVSVSAILMHPNYSPSKHYDDIALLKLDTDVHWSDFVRPACLPDSDQLSTQSLTIAGWGLTDELSNGGRRANVLRKVSLPLVENSRCLQWYRQEGKSISLRDTQMCAGYKEGGMDACAADSGGPLLQRQGQQFSVVGIISAGFGCARPNLIGVYTRVSKYTDWISLNVV